jgi:hypothetical protein
MFLFRVGTNVKWDGKPATIVDRRMQWSVPFQCDMPRYKIKVDGNHLWVKEFELQPAA